MEDPGIYRVEPASRGTWWPIAAFTTVYVLLGLLHLFFGRMTGDEGWYALAARNVSEGKVPYRDFLFAQMPLVPYLGGLWFKIVGSSLEAARLLSLLLGASAATLAMLACRRLAGPTATIICGILLTLNLHFVFDTVTFKTQSLTVALTALLILTLSKPGVSVLRLAAAMTFASLALLSRLSLLPALLLLWVYALWLARERRLVVGGMIAANTALLAAIFGYLNAGGNMLFGVYQLHHEYFGHPPWTLERLVFLFLKDWATLELLVIFCGCWAVVFLVQDIAQKGLAAWRDENILLRLYLLGSYAGVTLIHMINVQSHATHQTSVLIFGATLGACALASRLDRLEVSVRRWAMVSLFFLAALSAPLQEWNIHFNGDGSTGKIREVARVIRQNALPGDTLLSFNAELAVNSGLAIPPGYDMSEFGYFPAMETARADSLKILNFETLARDISSRQYRIFCVGDREFSLMAAGNPEVAAQLKELLGENYREVAKFDGYGQFFGTMYVFVRKD